MNNEGITSLENNPILKLLLKDYCKMQYEENAILDDEHLLMEYNLLLKENRQGDLFECERLNNSYCYRPHKEQKKEL